MIGQIRIVHADAGIADGEFVLRFIQFQIDARLEDQGLVRLLGERQVVQLVERVGCIRYELAEKNLRMGIEGVNDQLQQLIHFGLKFAFGHEFLF